MGVIRNFGPWEWLILILVLVIVFGWKRLPDIARSMGRSARVLRSEVDEMKEESRAAKTRNTTVSSERVRPETVDPQALEAHSGMSSDETDRIARLEEELRQAKERTSQRIKDDPSL